MRVKLTIALLICFAVVKAQDHNLRSLMGMKKLNCSYVDSVVQHKILSLKADERQDSIPKLLAYWQANCQPSEAMVRVQLLNDFEQGYPMVELKELTNYILEYHDHLRYQEAYSDILDTTVPYRFLKYTQNWADSLLNASVFKNEHEKFVLKTLAVPTVFQAEYLAMGRFYPADESMAHLQRQIRIQNETFVVWEVGLLSYHYQGELSRYIGIAPALHLGIGVRINEPWEVLLYGQLGFSNFKRNLRINEFDSTQSTKGNHSLTVGLQAGYKFLNTRNFDLKFIGAAAYEFQDVGLEEERINSEGETYNQSIGLHSYNLALGLQTEFRLYRYRHLGIRTTYHFTDFNLGTRALNNMSGGYFALGLIFH